MQGLNAGHAVTGVQLGQTIAAVHFIGCMQPDTHIYVACRGFLGCCLAPARIEHPMRAGGLSKKSLSPQERF